MRRVLAWFMRKTFGVDLDEGARWRREACLRDGYSKYTIWSLLTIPTMGLDPACPGRDRTAYGVFPFARDDH